MRLSSNWWSVDQYWNLVLNIGMQPHWSQSNKNYFSSILFWKKKSKTKQYHYAIVITSNVNFHVFYMSLYIRRGIWGQQKFYPPKSPNLSFFFHCISWPTQSFCPWRTENSSVLSSSMTFFPLPIFLILSWKTQRNYLETV